MKIINLDIVNEKLFYEKLDNGLDVYIIKKEKFYTEEAVLVTNFGGLDLEFVPINEDKMVTMPSGIAHFLEHKLFEQEDGESVHDFYNKTGTYVNAATDYKTTKYYFVGVNNFYNNLNYLLDFVGSPYFTDENVLKEKGIIIEEANMCLDDIGRVFNQAIYKNLFNNIRYDKTVIGSIDDIKSITKEDLYRCYNTFYHPSNMALFIFTNKDELEVLNVVKENQSKKEYKKDFKIQKKIYNEDLSVRKEYEVIDADSRINRVCYSFKQSLKDYNMSLEKVSNYLSIMLDSLIGSLSNFNLELKEKSIINGDINFYFDKEKVVDDIILHIHIYASPNDEELFIKLLEDEFNKIIVNEDDFNLYKKDNISYYNYSFNNLNKILYFLISKYENYGRIDEEIIKDELNINYDEFKEVVKRFNIKNKYIVSLKKQN